MTESATTQHEFSAYPPAGRAWMLTSLLLLIYVLGFIDRQVLNLLVEPIKQDLDFTDVQISYIQGIAFAATYVVISLPLGWAADHMNRVRLIGAGLAFWSVATMACGMSRSFVQLFAARAGVGVGEAVLAPTAWSLLADSFPPERRATPNSLYLAGPYIGGGLALMFGASVLSLFNNEMQIAGVTLKPWQMCFLVVGAPGLLLAVVMGVMREPKRIFAAHEVATASGVAPFIAHVRRRGRVYTGIWLGAGFQAVMLYGLQAWTTVYLMRVHNWEIAEAGYRYGIVALIAGSAGVLSGPVIHRVLRVRTGQDHTFSIGMICGTTLAVTGLLLPIVSSSMALATIAALSFFTSLPFALMTTATQQVTPNRMRGTATGVFVVSTNILGLGFGPTIVALFTERVFQDLMSIGNALTMLFLIFGILSTIFYNIGRRGLTDFSESQQIEDEKFSIKPENTEKYKSDTEAQV